VLAGAGTAELLVGIPAAALSGWLSGRLLPDHGQRWSAMGILRFCGRFLRYSLKAGVDVALMAFRPEMRLNPGFVSFPSEIPAGPVCGLFNGINSLMPGTLAVEPDADGNAQYHCLDIGKPILAELRDHETCLLSAYHHTGGRV